MVILINFKIQIVSVKLYGNYDQWKASLGNEGSSNLVDKKQ